jgi:hypothetical protein
MARLYVTDIVLQGIPFPHQLELETAWGAGGNASQLFRIANQMNTIQDYSVGIFGPDLAFKVCMGAGLTATTQSDNNTMIRTLPSGIVDLPNQSRVRAYQLDPQGFIQTVPPNIWVPINFTNESPLPQGYDEQNEFIVAPAANVGGPPEMSFFIAITEGYYQVNARCEFAYAAQVNPGSYVSIAIYKGPGPGFTSSYAIGNNLQIGIIGQMGEPYQLINNNAPNVSDVVYMMPGEIISIWVFHSAITPMNLIQGANKCYVSIHKVS